MNNTAHKFVHFRLYDPSGPSLFKSKKNEKAYFETVSCSNSENCDLFKKKQCTWIGIMSYERCPYGNYSREYGQTSRAKSFRSWISVRRTNFKDISSMEHPTKKLAFIGEYVYIPYNHVNMNKSVPFLSHGNGFVSGSSLLKKEDWTAENIKSIVDFSPQALMGGEITSYQKEAVPLFLLHLEEVDKKAYDNFIDKYPEYIAKYSLENKNYIGRTALLKTLNYPFDFTTKGSRDGSYSVQWKWDGKTLRTESKHAYNETWGEIRAYDKMCVVLEPNDETKIAVQDNTWVKKETVFVD